MAGHWRIGGVAALVVAVGAVVAVLLPLPVGAWPWDDDDTQVTVSGQVNCIGFDASGESRIPYGRVEGFEIRGRSNVVRNNADGYATTYEVTVPTGWVIEYSVKCSNRARWTDGVFEVSKTVVGTSSRQERHVCVGGGLTPCIAQNWGHCIMLWATGGWRPQVPHAEDAFLILNDLGSGGPTDIEGCARVVRDALPALHVQPTPQAPPGDASTLPEPTVEPEQELTTIPVTPTPDSPEVTATPTPDSGDDNPGGSGGPGATGTPEPTPSDVSDAVVAIDNRVTNGAGMREDDAPAYLSAVTENYCRSRGCMVAGTEMGSGHQVVATCQVTGARTTNGHDSDPADDANPERFESTRWYRIAWPDGRTGYLSEVWVAAAHRGGLGLPGC
jgi:hypothetical protein